ncbi:MAG: FKBP-type peptidyl-prolyl cis-trans isomerase [Planctomycetota bacterium]|nr:FKBP-type peptidyl-prolyl cis-trans isomerase [Planctomycetota bacterium]
MNATKAVMITTLLVAGLAGCSKEQLASTPAPSNPSTSNQSTGNQSPSNQGATKDSAAMPNTPAAAEPVTRPDGLIIQDLVVGTGKVAPPSSTVTIHYRGTLTDGSEFDSSYSRGQPATFPLDRLIKGWQEGIPGMKVGGKRKLTIPYQLAYGEAGRPPVIPPKATLIFEIELFDVK